MRNHRIRLGTFVLAAMTLAITPARAATWQDSVRQLRHERTLAESCASVIKRFGDTGAQARGSVAYDEAKADYDSVISGLIVALAKGQRPDNLTGLQTLLERGFDERTRFCDAAQKLLPPSDGEKDWVTDIAKAAIEPVVGALKDIYLRYRDEADITRKTIQTQLEDAKWPSFASVPPLP